MKSWKCPDCFWTNAAGEKYCKRPMTGMFGRKYFCDVPRKRKALPMTAEEERLDRLGFAIWFHGRNLSDPACYKAAVWDRLRDANRPSRDMVRSMDAARAALAFFAAEAPAPVVVSCACRAKRKGSLKIIG